MSRNTKVAIGIGVVVLILVALLMTRPDRLASREAESVDIIQDINWQWGTVTNQTTNQMREIPQPQNYNLVFKSDRTFTGKADCNDISGTYTYTADSFTITVTTSTRAFCGDNSMDQEYLQYLSEVKTGGLNNRGGLTLETGKTTLGFNNAGPAE